ncbi:MAG TPA: GNAT family N-acetyltransferase [bacterium]|nr:GNAT family N-acetyltransferase [bacterium]
MVRVRGGVPRGIRDARPDDREAVRALTLAAYEEYAAAMPEAFWAVYRRNLVATLDTPGPEDRIVAEDGGVVVGSVFLYPPEAAAYGARAQGSRWPEVRLLAVPPSARGRGIGQALMDECVHRARVLGAEALGLHTMDMMRAAVRRYERMAFVRAPETDFAPGGGILVKGYRLKLTGAQ